MAISEKYWIEASVPNGEGESRTDLYQPLNPDDGRKLYRELQALFELGCKRWEINMEGLPSCDTTTLGALLMIHGMARRFSGCIGFRVPLNSSAHRAMQATRLNRIMSINLV